MRVGIDRVLLKGLNIYEVNLELLKSKGFVVIQDNDKSIRVMRDEDGEDVYINYIKLSKQHDNTLLLNELRIGQKEIKGDGYKKKIEYEYLDVTLPNSLNQSGTNEENVSNIIDLVKSLGVIERELRLLGFGDVNLLESELKKIELNINIDLLKPFKEYERIFEYFQELLPKRIKTDTNNTYRPNNSYTGFKAGNKSISLKLYNKKESMKKINKRDIGKERLRIEYTFLSEQKIKDTFGSNKLGEIIIDNFNVIEEAFKIQLENDLVKRVYKDIERQLKLATREIARYKEAGVKMSGQELIFDNDILDIEIVLAALKKNTRSNHYARECKTLINRCLEGKQKKLFGNIAKINEILKALGFQTIHLDMTRHIQQEVAKNYLFNDLISGTSSGA